MSTLCSSVVVSDGRTVIFLFGLVDSGMLIRVDFYLIGFGFTAGSAFVVGKVGVEVEFFL